MREIYLAGGSFWDLQRYFDCVVGVLETQAGFANGNIVHPSYMEVCTGKTGFAEVVRIRFDEDTLPLPGMLELFFKAISSALFSPEKASSTSQHRLGIFIHDLRDREQIHDFTQKIYDKNKHVSSLFIEPLQNYYPAEEYHQNYHQKNPNGYCHIGREAFTYAGQYKV